MYLRVHCMHCVVSTYACGLPPICPTHYTTFSAYTGVCSPLHSVSRDCVCSNDRCYPRMHFAARKLLMALKCGVFAVLKRPVFYFILFNNLLKLNWSAALSFRVLPINLYSRTGFCFGFIGKCSWNVVFYRYPTHMVSAAVWFITQSSVGLATIQSELCIIYTLILKVTLISSTLARHRWPSL